MDAIAVLRDLYFTNNPVTIETRLEGHTVDADRNFVLGCRAATQFHVSNLIHEMGHLAEREIPKLLKRPYSSWGFTFGKYWEVLGMSGYEPQTDQSVLREMRVWAYQYSISQHFGFALGEKYEDETYDLVDLVGSSIYMPAFCLYSRKVATKSDYREAEREAIEIMAMEVLELSKTKYTFDHFQAAWQERMAALATLTPVPPEDIAVTKFNRRLA